MRIKELNVLIELAEEIERADRRHLDRVSRVQRNADEAMGQLPITEFIGWDRQDASPTEYGYDL